MRHKEEKCFNCSKTLNNKKVYILYSLIVNTNVRSHFIGLLKLIEGLADHLMDKYIHLSASQVILLRPDILEEYLVMKLKPEHPIL